MPNRSMRGQWLPNKYLYWTPGWIEILIEKSGVAIKWWDLKTHRRTNLSWMWRRALSAHRFPENYSRRYCTLLGHEQLEHLPLLSFQKGDVCVG
ncbi:hypothetical protein AGR1B_pa0186 [Agrobacterium fabacearum S56]|nr:hypothetical protein AGR1B_pa0186 [Agrobacterium fabacearum S56]